MASITELIEVAHQEGSRQMLRLLNMRKNVTIEQFKALFISRAQQAMVLRKNFSEFIIDDMNREVINTMYRYIMKNENCDINPYIGIVLNGAYGCGKSVLIEAFCMVLNDITIQDSNKIKVVHAIELAEDIKLNGIIPYARCPLCIQDFGKEAKVVNNFGTLVNPISELLAVRAEYGSLTFGSTNQSLKDFSEAYKEYVAKRITEHINWVFLPGKDRRPNYSKNQP
jgi:hypothetical protein